MAKIYRSLITFHEEQARNKYYSPHSLRWAKVNENPLWRLSIKHVSKIAGQYGQ